jgi:hypothetical protein
MWKFLYQAYDVVAEITDHSTPEISKFGDLGRFGVVDEHREIGQRIGRLSSVVPTLVSGPIFDDTVRKSPRRPRLRPEVGVA